MSEKKLLSRDDLLKGDELKIEKVSLGDGFIYVREMNGREHGAFERAVVILGKEREVDVLFRAKLVVRTACDEKGKLLFQSEDAEKLAEQISAHKLGIIAEASSELNQIGKRDVTEKK